MTNANQSEIVLAVEGLHKKFTKDIKYNMYYGILDLISERLNPKTQLRKKEFWALKDINLKLHRGEICGVIGENGSGKTTLMRIISSIYPFSSGKLKFESDLRVTPIFAVRAGISALFTGYENIHILGSLYGMSKEEIESKMEFIEEFSELGSSLNSPCGNYSSGMKARLGYTIAAATDPDIFIIDEALAVGDLAFRDKCFKNLEDLALRGKSILFVTNNNLKVEKIATRVIVMKKGEIVRDSRNISETMSFYTSDSYSKL